MKNRLRTLREIEDELNLRLRGSRQSQQSSSGKANWEFRGSRGGVDRRLRQLGKRGGSGGSGGSGEGGGGSRQQRVIVKASYSVHKPGKSGGVLRAHVRYLGRDSASLDGEEGRFYDAREEDIDAKARVQGWQQDRHHFRFIISPEEGHQIDAQKDGMTGYVRQVMARAEKDLKTKLDWAAINHHNTDDRHAHVLVRGNRDDGQDLVIPRDYIKRGMAQTAQTIATRRLGERTDEQIQEQGRKDLRAQRYTPLDAAIEKRLDGDRRLRLQTDRTHQSETLRRRVAGRLQHLESMDLASKDRHGRWTVDAELKPKLAELSQRNDIIKNLYPTLGQRAATVAAYRSEKELVGYAAGSGTHDELRDQRYLLVRDAERQTHYVRMANSEALRGLEEGGLVRVQPRDPTRAKTDARIAEVAQTNDGIYTTEAHRRSLPDHFAAGDVEGFVRSHGRRLQTLARAGAVSPTKGGWRVHDATSLARGDHARNRHGGGTVEVLSAHAIQSQTSAEAWTWLDRQMHRKSQGKPTAVPFDRTLEQAATARKRWMVERGYASQENDQFTLRPGAANALRQSEQQRVEREYQQRFGKPVKTLAPGAEAVGTYQGVAALHNGTNAVIDGRREVVLAPVKRAAPLEHGTPVQAKANGKGEAVITANQKPRHRERGVERE